MLVNATEFQNNVGKYLSLADNEEVVIIRNGRQIARLLGMDKTVSFLSDKLLGVLPDDLNLSDARDERLARQ